MNTTKRVSVTLDLPEELYERASLKAACEQREVNEVLSSTLEAGLIAPETARELLEHASQSYRAQLAAQGKLDQTDEEIFAELREVREQIADELYPELPSSRAVSTTP